MYLADVVISISLEGDRDALHEESTEALTGGTSQLNVDTVVRQTSLLIPPVYTGIDMRTIHTQIGIHTYKPVGDWISAPSPNFVAMATRVGPTTLCMVPLNRPSPPKKPW